MGIPNYKNLSLHYIPFHEIILVAMSDNSNYLELEPLWERLLSREEMQVKTAFSSLSESEQEAVLIHLRRMAQEDGWHSEQRISAQIALDVLKEA